jgi:hypothetical protein
MFESHKLSKGGVKLKWSLMIEVEITKIITFENTEISTLHVVA